MSICNVLVVAAVILTVLYSVHVIQFERANTLIFPGAKVIKTASVREEIDGKLVSGFAFTSETCECRILKIRQTEAMIPCKNNDF